MEKGEKKAREVTHEIYDSKGHITHVHSDETLKVVHNETIKAYLKSKDKNAQGFVPIDYMHHTKANIDELSLLNQELSVSEIALISVLIPYIRYDDNHLAYNNGADLGTEDIVSISGMGRGTCYDVIAKLIKKDILYRGENSRTKQYFVNPWLYVKGNRVNKVLRTMFRNYRIRSRGNIPWGKMHGYDEILD